MRVSEPGVWIMCVFGRSSNTRSSWPSMSIRRTPIAVAATGLSPYAHAHAHTAAVMALAPAPSASRLALVLEAGAKHVEETGGNMDYLKGVKKTIQKARGIVPPPVKRQNAMDHVAYVKKVAMEKEEKVVENLFGKLTTKEPAEKDEEDDVVGEMLEQAEQEDMAAKEAEEEESEEEEIDPREKEMSDYYAMVMEGTRR